MSDAVVACPYCRAPASGRFCANCGKPLDLGQNGTVVTRDILGLKLPDYRSIGRTVWLAITQPQTLSRRWCAGDRHQLTSPVALLAIVSASAATVAVVAARLTGNQAPAQADLAAMSNVLDAAPFLRSWFKAAAVTADADPQAFGDKLRQVGAWWSAAWPLLFLVPGLLVLAPWRRISRHDALIVACTETVMIMTLAALYAVLRIAAPAAASSLLVTTAIWLLLCAHTAWHIRNTVAGASIGYAITRPILATLVFPVIVYAWMVGVASVTLLLMPVLAN